MKKKKSDNPNSRSGMKSGHKMSIKSDPTKRVKPYRVIRKDVTRVDADGNRVLDHSVYWSFYRVNCKRRNGGAGAAAGK
jgi:hypothetical protein